MRNVAGVILGVALAAALMIGTNLVLIERVTATSAVFISITLLDAVVYHLLGGYVCAAISRDAARATWSLVVVGTCLLLSSVIQTWSQMPRWYSLGMLVIVPVSLWLGTRLHARRAIHAPRTA